MDLPPPLNHQFSIGNIIGKGRFSNVHVCKNKTTGAELAVKIVTKGLNILVDEVAILKALNHSNIIKYITHAETTDNLFIITDYVKGEDLLAAFQRMTFSMDGVAFVMTGLMKALSYLHNMKIVHRTIKPASIFLQFSKNKPIVVKLGDFGKAAKLVDGIQVGDWGQPEYRAPEMMCAYNCKVDIFAAGVIFMEFYLPRYPRTSIIDMHCAALSFGFNPDLNDLKCGMIHLNPMMRFSANDVLNHAWIRKFSTN